ncbi:SdpA family antimicrobial peptide system protein [Flavobacterium sp. HTF]|uniref:SdpA family antimicrobial peptide system protein n=1 Tax=Flavobacterium sp. HTF TaxID=2170732 RepID=UPI000D5E1F21|nr:SdpA family antimicrobial peptide system protein [Flavobacterium sp. HTF]PWB25858.1 hypothetical protein DCO46_07365 [Flavobacterium sp. HTF]
MKRAIFFKLTLICGWILFGVSVFFSSLKSQLILNENLKEFTNKVLPQGWGFFTKNPRDFVLRIYKIRNGKLEEMDISNQSLKNRLGFSRSARIIGYEMSIIAEKVKNNDWKQNSTGNIYDNINDKMIVINTDFSFKHVTKGNYLLKLYRPIPYMWAKFNQENFNRFLVVKVCINDNN